MKTRYERLRDGRSRLWRKRRAQSTRRKTLRNRVTHTLGLNVGGAQSVKQIRPENLFVERVVAQVVSSMRRDYQQQQSR